MALRRSIAITLVIAVLLVAAAALVLLNSEARASALCGAEGFSVASPSLWPPGASCVGGQPSFEVTILDPLHVVVLAAVSLGLYGAYAVARPPARRTRARRYAR